MSATDVEEEDGEGKVTGVVLPYELVSPMKVHVDQEEEEEPDESWMTRYAYVLHGNLADRDGRLYPIKEGWFLSDFLRGIVKFHYDARISRLDVVPLVGEKVVVNLEDPIELETTPAATRLIIDYMDGYKDRIPIMMVGPIVSSSIDDVLPSDVASLLNVDMGVLVEVANMADYLQIESLQNHVAAKMASMLYGTAPREIIKQLGLPQEYTLTTLREEAGKYGLVSEASTLDMDSPFWT